MDALKAKPMVVYETSEMTPEQIAKFNADHAAMGTGLVAVDVSMFSGKLELMPDGTYKRSTIRRKKNGHVEA
jgi:hypothetical protein